MSAVADESAPSAVVVGGGIAGLASAALLAREGYVVTVLEKNAGVGGRAGFWERDGFRFDTGPSWFLMPEVFEHFFRLCGTTTADQLDLVPLEPSSRVFFEEELSRIDLGPDKGDTLETFERVEPGAGVRLAAYLDSAEETYRTALEHFLYSTFEDIRSSLPGSVLRRGGRLVRLMTESLARFAARPVRDPRLQQVLAYPAVFLGTSPYAAPSMYHLMSHLDLGQPARYPLGGFATVIDRIAALAVDAGARIRTSSRAVRIETTEDSVRPRVTGVEYVDESGARGVAVADIVVLAADLPDLEDALLPSPLVSHPASYWDARTPGPGAVLVLLGVRGALPELVHHNLLFARNWRSEFARVFPKRDEKPDRSPRTPTSFYVCKPSQTDRVAPDGHEALFLLVPVPADVGLGGGGHPQVEAIADAAIGQLGEWAGIEDLRERIVLRRTIGPADFARDVGAWRGSALGPAHTLRQSAFFRTRNASAKVDGLLFAGGSTTPGIGLPMCLISAELVIKRLRGDTGASPLAEPR